MEQPFFLFFFSSSNKIDNIEIVKGKGVTINGDSVIFDKTSVIDLINLLKIKKMPLVSKVMWDGIDNSGIFYAKSIDYKSIVFEYVGDDTSSLKLDKIAIKQSLNLKVKLCDSVYLSDKSPNIDKCYYIIDTNDFISINKLNYYLPSQGIDVIMDSFDNKRVIKELVISKIQNN